MPRAKRDFSKRVVEPTTVYLLRVALEGIRPAIWRELLAPSDMTFARLHQAIQQVMPWSDSHLHQFDVLGEILTDPAFELDYEVEDEGAIVLCQMASRTGDKFVYEYDLGDGWRHVITAKKILPIDLEDGAPKIQCVGGARACPPDDCGGPVGYRDLLAALSRPNHESHEESTEWLANCRAELSEYDVRFSGPFDPEAFDLEAANRALAKLGTRRRRG